MAAIGPAISFVSKAATLVAAASRLLDAAGKLKGKSKSSSKDNFPSQLGIWIGELKAHSEKQAEVISQLAQQNQSLSAKILELEEKTAAIRASTEKQSESISQLSAQSEVLDTRVSELEAKRKGFLSRLF